jgi:WD40 repeat protein
VTGYADRAVEVLCEVSVADQHLGWTGRGSPVSWISSSGLLVTDRLVLTAAHAVTADGTVTVRGVDKVEHPALVLLLGGERADLALLELSTPMPGVSALRFGSVDREAAMVIRECRAIGYPAFQSRPAADGRAVRDTAQLDGEIPTADQRVADLLTLRVTSTPRPLPPQQEALGRSQWSGVSGSVVVTGRPGDEVVLGVVTEHQPRAGESALTVTPITHIDRLPNARLWWRELGCTPASLVRLPSAPRHVSYRSVILEIAGRTPDLLDRAADLAALRAFATGSPGYRRVVGSPWAGKTALAAHLAADPPSGVDCVAYLLQRRALDASAERFLAAVTGQLASLLGEEPPADPDAASFAELWARAADRAERLERHLLLIVDGLDEDLRPAGQRSVASLLPSRTPFFTHVLVTGRKAPLPDDVHPDHPLWTVDPVELTQVVEAQRIEQRAEIELRDLAADAATRGVLGVLTAAAGPLTADELALVTASSPFDLESLLRDRFGRVAENLGGWRFAHQSLLDTCRDTVFGPARLAPFAAQVDAWAGGWAGQGWPMGTPRYLLEHRPWAVMAAGGDLGFLADPGWLATAVGTLGVDAVVPMLRTGAATSPGVRPALRVLEIAAPAVRTPSTSPAQQLCLTAVHTGLPAEPWRRAASRSAGAIVAVSTTGRASRSLMRSLDAGSRQVWAAAFAAPSRLVTGDEDGRVRRWNLEDGRVADIGRHFGAIRAIAVSPSGDTVVACAADRTVRLWPVDADVFSLDVPPLVSNSGQIWAVAYAPGADRIATGGQDVQVRLWDLATGQATVVGQHDDQVRSLVFSPDGSLLISGGRDDTVRVWSLESGTGRVLGRVKRWAEALAITPDGSTVIAGSYIGQVIALGLDGVTRRVLGQHEGQVWSVAVTPDGREVVSGGGDGQILAWPLVDSSPEAASFRTLDGDLVTGRVLGSHRQPVRCVTVSPDGERVASSAAEELIHVWDRFSDGESDRGAPWTAVAIGASATSGLTLEGNRRPGDSGHSRSDRTGGVVPGGVAGGGLGGGFVAEGFVAEGFVVGGRQDGELRVWQGSSMSDYAFGQPIHGVAVTREGIAALLDDGRIDWADAGAPGSANLWHEGGRVIAASPDGVRLVAGGGPGGVSMWTSGTLSQTWPEVGREVTAITVADDGLIVTGHLSGSVRILRPGADPIRVHPGEEPIWAVTLHDGHAYSGDAGGQIRRWDLATGNQRIIATTGGAVTGLGIAGSALVTGGEDGLRLWSLPDGRLTAYVKTEPLRALAADPGDCAVVTISAALGLTRWEITG